MNPCVIKLEGCQYKQKNQEPNLVIIYYYSVTDLFGIVDSKSNVLLNFDIATEVDYANIFNFKSISEDRFMNEAKVCLSSSSNQPKSDLNLPVDQCEKANVLTYEEYIDLLTKTYGY